jgi:nitroimidazol reductase NimA-like FMN-containing flavoprotein (pyridoxamine 5'-phosphate oxidase superfamily)
MKLRSALAFTSIFMVANAGGEELSPSANAFLQEVERRELQTDGVPAGQVISPQQSTPDVSFQVDDNRKLIFRNLSLPRPDTIIDLNDMCCPNGGCCTAPR